MSSKLCSVSVAILVIAAALPFSAIAHADQVSDQGNNGNIRDAIGGLLGTQTDRTNDQDADRATGRRYNGNDDRRSDRIRDDRSNRNGSDYNRRNQARSDQRAYEDRDRDCRFIQRDGRRERVCD